MGAAKGKLTPAMRQFVDIKEQHQDCIVLFRMGDFYETFYDDAKLCAQVLDITLTARGKGESKAPLAGIPYHALDTYLPKLVAAGHKVCIVEQVEDPKLAKGIVKRDVARIVSPGTCMEDSMLNNKTNNFLTCIHIDTNQTNKKKSKQATNSIGIATIDISTGTCLVTTVPTVAKLHLEITKLQPKEVLVNEDNEKEVKDLLGDGSYYINTTAASKFKFSSAYQALTNHFDVLNLEGFGIESQPVAIVAAGACMMHLKDTQKTTLQQVQNIRLYNANANMIVDRSTARNLEVFSNISEHTKNATVIDAIDQTVTSMGARLLRFWLSMPLIDRVEITRRHAAVAFFCEQQYNCNQARVHLKQIPDIERLVGRISHGCASPKDVLSLGIALQHIPNAFAEISNANTELLKELLVLPDVSSVQQLIENAIDENAPTILTNGNIMKSGYNKQLDELREISTGGKSFIAKLEAEEKKKTGIKSLKVGYNKVFGYYIEVTKANLGAIPDHYIRRQTQVNSERFITPELKDIEEKILGAEEKIVGLEQQLFKEVVDQIATHTKHLQAIAVNVAILDVMTCFAFNAVKQQYVKPTMTDKQEINILEGRHPVVEQLTADPFVPNDCTMNSNRQMHIITGPNMAGKSTYMRQVAITLLLAQVGSFVPAKKATLPIVDRIFTRVGAHDDLAMGQSTFMVEMQETANILHNATEKSFVVLDEIGRGTSTYDGLSIAWSVAEEILEGSKALTLFATHYHVMNHLTLQKKGVVNVNIAVKEHGGELVFLRKIVEGGTDKSYGIEVAKIAGVPQRVIDRAYEFMNIIEVEDRIGDKLNKNLAKDPIPKATTVAQVANQVTKDVEIQVEELQQKRTEKKKKKTSSASLLSYYN